jgi:hypothetical protein
MTLTTPFERPDIVMKKVTRHELLTTIRAHVNSHYMPSGGGNVQYNSKPEYVRHRLRSDKNSYWPSVGPADQTGFFAFDSFETMGEGLPTCIYLFIRVAPIYILVRLDTCEMMVAFEQVGEQLAFFPWNEDDQAVAIDRFDLQEAIEFYV